MKILIKVESKIPRIEVEISIMGYNEFFPSLMSNSGSLCEWPMNVIELNYQIQWLHIKSPLRGSQILNHFWFTLHVLMFFLFPWIFWKLYFEHGNQSYLWELNLKRS